jgi:hypothetical protein
MTEWSRDRCRWQGRPGFRNQLAGRDQHRNRNRDQHHRHKGGGTSLNPATVGQPVSMHQVNKPAVGFAYLVRDCVPELLRECFVTPASWILGGQCGLRLLAQESNITNAPPQNLSDLPPAQPDVPLKDDRNPFIVTQQSKVGNDRLDRGRSQQTVNQLDARSMLPWQRHGPTRDSDHGTDRLHTWTRHLGPPAVKLREG